MCKSASSGFTRLVAVLAASQVVSALRRARRRSNATSMAFDQALFMATHNSYELKPMGVVQTLDLGVRMLEFDIRLYDFESKKEYCVGHDRCYDGDTDDGEMGNPSSHFLNAWLEQVRSWSRSHADHAPITVFLDMKDDLASGAKTFAQGGLSNLQHTMQSIFGDSLYWASSKPSSSWPSVDSLRGKVMGVLSGNTNSRISYQQDEGKDPHVAINEAGLVVEVHENSGSSSIYYWTGKADGDTITWSRHGKIDTGRDVWVTMSDDNTVVECHKSENHDRIYYRVGSLDPATLEMSWGSSHDYDNGVSPTCRILANGQLEERHRSQNTGKVWVRRGTVNAASRTISWRSGAVQRNIPLFDSVAYSLSGSKRAEVRAQSGLVEARLQAQQAFQKIRYPQLFFVDWQPGCSMSSEQSAPLNTGSFIGVSRTCGGPPVVANVATRVWGYSMSDAQVGKNPGSFPATDKPGAEYKSWVLNFANGIAY